jgi:multicomponent Na+:H+ antiporter subunit C
MEGPLAIVVGVMFGAGVYAMLRSNLLRLVVGLILLTSAANVLIFTVGGLVRANPPLVPRGEVLPPAPYAPPLPQAMILTAIVIGFGLTVFALVLVLRAYEATGEVDPDAMRVALTSDEDETGPAAREEGT